MAGPGNTARIRPWWMDALCASMFVLAAGNGVLFGLLADLRAAHGLSKSDLALIASTVFAVGLVSQLALSGLADRGRARILLLVGIASMGLSLVWFAFATTLWQFVAARALSGLANGAFTPAARAMTAAHDPSEAGRHLGRLTAFEVGGFVLGPAIGSLVADRWGLAAPFLALAVPAGITFALLVAAGSLPERHHPRVAWWRTGGLDLLRLRPVIVAAGFSAVLYLPVGIYDALWDQYLTDLGASPLFTGVSLTLYGLPIVILSHSGGRLADRIGPLRAGLLSLFVVVPATFAYGVLPGYWLVAFAALVEAAAQAVATPASQAAMAAACPPQRSAAGQGLAGAVGLATAGLSAAIGPVVYEHLGAAVTFGAAAVAMAVVGLAVAALDRAGWRVPELMVAEAT